LDHQRGEKLSHLRGSSALGPEMGGMSHVCSRPSRTHRAAKFVGACTLRAWLAPLLFCLSMADVSRAHASPWAMRATGAAAGMLSGDQIGRLAYNRIGFLGTLSLSRELLPYFGVQASVRGGTFLSDRKAGGVVGGGLGFLVRGKEAALVPYASAELGCAFTGELVRPWLSVALGLDFRVTPALSIGPALGVDDVVQRNQPGASTDAVFMWLGIAFRYWPPPAAQAPKPKTAPPPVRAEPVAETPEINEQELLTLIEDSIDPAPVRQELLAPVLFGDDSARLEPQGIAMLHEVARTLKARPDIRLIEIRGYADRRGSEAHNRVLSEERARQVEGWLIEHGIARQRLRIVAEGEREPVELGTGEGEQAQNRRVVFRILETSAP
jgi:outer membrane protein OmpA-like peptidoglycan-associated protein